MRDRLCSKVSLSVFLCETPVDKGNCEAQEIPKVYTLPVCWTDELWRVNMVRQKWSTKICLPVQPSV